MHFSKIFVFIKNGITYISHFLTDFKTVNCILLLTKYATNINYKAVRFPYKKVRKNIAKVKKMSKKVGKNDFGAEIHTYFWIKPYNHTYYFKGINPFYPNPFIKLKSVENQLSYPLLSA